MRESEGVRERKREESERVSESREREDRERENTSIILMTYKLVTT